MPVEPTALQPTSSDTSTSLLSRRFIGVVIAIGGVLLVLTAVTISAAFPSRRALALIVAQSVVAAIGGILLLNERLTWPLLAGGGLIILGVAISQFGPLMQKPRLASGARPASQRR